MSSGLSEADRLIVEAATGSRRLTRAELRHVLGHVAAAGFDPDARERAGGRLAGIEWRGHVLRGSDMLPPGEVHYLRHVVARREWPDGVTLDEYLDSIREAILDADAGVLTSRFHARWQVTVVRRSGRLQGPEGFAWLLAEYRLELGQWMTAFQTSDAVAYLMHDLRRREQRWLRRPG